MKFAVKYNLDCCEFVVLNMYWNLGQRLGNNHTSSILKDNSLQYFTIGKILKNQSDQALRNQTLGDFKSSVMINLGLVPSGGQMATTN